MSLLAKIEDVLPGLMREYKATGGFTNWHGGPHEFAAEAGAPYGRFSMKKLGTGQGAQSFGIGHYTADYRPVGEDYQRTLSAEQPKFEHPELGVISPSKLTEYLASVGIAGSKGKIGKLKAMQMGEEVMKTSRRGEDALIRFHERLGKGVYPDQKTWQEMTQAASHFKLVPNKGHLYEVKIKGHPIEDFLQQDRPISAQSRSVQEGLENLGVPITDDFAKDRMLAEDVVRSIWKQGYGAHPGVRAALFGIKEAPNYKALRDSFMDAETAAHELSWDLQEPYLDLLSKIKKRANSMQTVGYETGRGAYERLANRKGGYTKATEALREQGILGMRFLDAGSRGVGKGSYNTISFSDDVIEIVKRYGIAALVASGVISEEMGRALQQQGIDSTFEEEPASA